MLITVGILFPSWIWSRQRFVISNSHFGATPMRFTALRGPYFVGAIFAVLIGSVGYIAAIVGVAGFVIASKAATSQGVSLPAVPSVTVILLGLALFITMLVTGAIANAIFKVWTNNEAYSKTWIGPHRLNCELRSGKLTGIYLRNVVLTMLTLGLYIPWAQINLLRYQIDNLSLEVHGSLDEFVGTQQQQVSATGEELGDFLDIDFGL